MAKVRFTLLGTGSSGGVPRIGNDWGVCDPAEPKNRRRRCGALVERFADDGSGRITRVLIDTSPDLREQLLDARTDSLDGVVFTHDHADQTHGLDDVRALAIRMRKQVPAWMDAPTRASLADKFRYIFEGKGDYPPIVALQPDIEPLELFDVAGPGGTIPFLPLEQEHGRIRSLGFRIGPLAYCNDVSDLPEASLEALVGVDIFIVDALRYRPHPTHAHVERALEWIDRLQPRHAILTNLHVDLDYRTLKAELPDNVEPAYDGMAVTIEP